MNNPENPLISGLAFERSSQRFKLLILDDDPLAGETIQNAARFVGFDAQYVSDPEEFFRLVLEWKPEVVGIDLIMPAMDGVEVIKKLGDQGSKSLVILTSGVGHRILGAAERSARSHGLEILGLLPKPFRISTVRELLDKAAQLLSIMRPSPPGAARGASSLHVTASDLAQALAARQISVAYQPKVSCRNKTLVGFEGLARWHHSEYGNIRPDVFIALAEENGLIDELTKQITFQALDWLAGLSAIQNIPGPALRQLQQTILSLNISARSLGNASLFDEIADYCRQRDISPGRIVLELTETSAMQETAPVLDNMTRLRLQGFHLSIDDFGTGYSSMVQLVKLPFSEIKVDKSFVISASKSEESRIISRSVVELGRSLQLSTTAEGVEDEEAFNYLKEVGCDYVQGYWISPPMAAEAVVPWFLARESQREQLRQSALIGLNILDTPAEAKYDTVTRIATRLFNASTAAISLIDKDRQWFKSRRGPCLNAVEETPREQAFCNTTIEADKVFIVQDALLDNRFADNPLVTQFPKIRFYAGYPLHHPDGHKIGALCLMDEQPQRFSDKDSYHLETLAQLIEKELRDRPVRGQTGAANLYDSDNFCSDIQAVLELGQKLELRATLVGVRVLNLPIVNQMAGTAHGDAMIKCVADSLQALAVDADLVGRKRGTEFAALYIDPEPDQIMLLCRALTLSIAKWNDELPDGMPGIMCQIAVSDIPPDSIGTGLKKAKNHMTIYSIVTDTNEILSTYPIN